MTTLRDLRVSFPPGVYADVRLEQVSHTSITLLDGSLQGVSTRTETGAMLRVFRDGRWYYGVTTDLGAIDRELAALATGVALPPGQLADAWRLLRPHTDRQLRFEGERIDRVDVARKLEILRSYAAILERPSVRSSRVAWVDYYATKRLLSSQGADVQTDMQNVGIDLRLTVAHQGETMDERKAIAGHHLDDVLDSHEMLSAFIDRCERFVAAAQPLPPGRYAVVMAPMVAGVFAHESFGHKSESDFMLGDPTMLEAWKLGTRVGAKGVSIVDSGTIDGSGWLPYDDEGQPATKTWLLKDGVLAGRLHSAATAAALDEACTGNARAMSFRYEPIVRMTNTWFEPGEQTREQLIEGVDDGILVETVRHGSGMSTFTIAPGMCWRIEGGVVTRPVRVAVITGTVFETLGLIDGLSDEVEMAWTVLGGCGKFEQWPLPVGLGGPYVRVSSMSVA